MPGAAQRLLGRIEHREHSRVVHLTHHARIRQSVGVPAVAVTSRWTNPGTAGASWCRRSLSRASCSFKPLQGPDGSRCGCRASILKSSSYAISRIVPIASSFLS